MTADYKCDKCGRLIKKTDVCLIYKDKILCGNCYSQIGTCVTCAHAIHCAYHEDQTSPDFVIKAYQTPMGYVQKQEINKDKYTERCVGGGCVCRRAENEICMRNIYGYCDNWTEKE